MAVSQKPSPKIKHGTTWCSGATRCGRSRQRYGLTIDKIKHANNMKSNSLRAGMKLLITGKKFKPLSSPPAGPCGWCFCKYLVKKKKRMIAYLEGRLPIKIRLMHNRRAGGRVRSTHLASDLFGTARLGGKSKVFTFLTFVRTRTFCSDLAEPTKKALSGSGGGVGRGPGDGPGYAVVVVVVRDSPRHYERRFAGYNPSKASAPRPLNAYSGIERQDAQRFPHLPVPFLSGISGGQVRSEALAAL